MCILAHIRRKIKKLKSKRNVPLSVPCYIFGDKLRPYAASYLCAQRAQFN